MRAMSRLLDLAAAGAIAITLAGACGHAPPPPAPKGPVVTADPIGPHADAIAAQAQPYIDAEIVTGLVVGIVDGDRTEIYGFGARDPAAPTKGRPDGRTVFELGSLTQSLTSLLLADAVARGEVAYDTELVRLMPMGVTVPTDGDQRITLEMLATHRSGLPSFPRSLVAHAFDADPYNGYDADRLYADLAAGRLDAPPGTVVHYAAWGVGVLGFALARATGIDYGQLVADRLAAPLHLDDTRVDVPTDAEARLAPGHTDDLGPAVPWHTSALSGAGALHSTARDLLVLVRAEIDAAHGGTGPLADRLRASQEVRIPADPRSVGLGWWVEKDGRLWHAGASAGYHAFVGFDPGRRQGVVVLAATSSTLVDRLGGSLLDTLAGAPTAPITFPDPSAFAPLVGRYQVGDAQADVVVRGKRLYLIEGDKTPTRLVPLSATEFFVESIQAPLAFDVEGGAARGLVIFINGTRVEGKRVGDATPPAR